MADEGQGKGEFIPKYMRVGTGNTLVAAFQSDSDIYTEKGTMYVGAGYNGRATKYGAALQMREFNAAASKLYTTPTATFTAATATIARADTTFATDGVVIGDFLTLTSASDSSYIGATGEILAVTETTLTVSMGSAGGDVPSNLTTVGLITYTAPLVSILDNGDMPFKIGVSPDASFKIMADDSNNEHAVDIVVKAGADGNAGVDIDYDSHTYSGTKAVDIRYDVDQFDEADDTGEAVNITIANTGATDGHAHGVVVNVSDPANTSLESGAFAAGPGVDLLHQEIGTAATLAAGYTHTGSTFTDATTAFNTAGTDVTIFDADNDYILVASATKFDRINLKLATASSRNIRAVFEYVTDAGAWVAFTPSDNTNGFQQNGGIIFGSANLTTWGVRTINEITGAGAADDYYWIRITRTRGNLPTSPIESTVAVTTIGSEYSWDKLGNIFCNTTAIEGGITAPSSIAGRVILYVDTADGSLKVIFGNGTVKTLATNS